MLCWARAGLTLARPSMSFAGAGCDFDNDLVRRRRTIISVAQQCFDYRGRGKMANDYRGVCFVTQARRYVRQHEKHLECVAVLFEECER